MKIGVVPRNSATVAAEVLSMRRGSRPGSEDEEGGEQHEPHVAQRDPEAALAR